VNVQLAPTSLNARQRLDEDLHAAAEAQDEMQRGFLLDIVVRQCASVLQLLASEDQPLLIRRNAFLVLAPNNAWLG
jgi:hypothetical protein